MDSGGGARYEIWAQSWRPVEQRIGRFRVVRDDLLPGGTKMRYLIPLIESLPHRTIVYASPAVGYAQIALAHVCRFLGRRAVIFVARRREMHPRTARARDAGAYICEVPHGYLSVITARARAYAEAEGAYHLPFGADVPEAIDHFAAAARTLSPAPREVWACSGSGALIRGLQRAWPGASFNAVRVGALPDVGAARLWTAPERYDRGARQPPPFPSCDNYDAKVWQFVNRHGSDDALIWNVGA